MTKTKKLNKIIPAVLLSGAMLMPVSQLTSPTIANACEISNYSKNDNSKVSLLEFKTKTELGKENLSDANYSSGNNIKVASGTSIIVDLNKKYSEFNVDLGTYHNSICPLEFEFIVDDESKEKVNVEAGTGEIGDTKDSPRVHIDLKDANTLEIKVKNAKNANDDYKNFSFYGELKNPTFTKSNKLNK